MRENQIIGHARGSDYWPCARIRFSAMRENQIIGHARIENAVRSTTDGRTTAQNLRAGKIILQKHLHYTTVSVKIFLLGHRRGGQ